MNQIKEESKLFVNGYPSPFGYAYNGVVDYNIKEGKVPFLRLKEWDFYQITSRKFSFYAIIGHVSYATSINCTLFDFETKQTYYVGKLVPFKKVEMDNNASSDSVILYKSKDYEMTFKKEGKHRFINMSSTNKTYGKCSVIIKLEETQEDNILVCTPFTKKRHFYLNQKNCLMKASGKICFGNVAYEVKENECFGLLDWGRGVLPFKHEWIWGNGSGIVDGKYFGFNIGSFGNNELGSENIFFYDGKSYKLDKVVFSFDKNNVMDNWEVHSDDDNFSFVMKPVYDNHTKTKLLWVDNECHQVFGNFDGYVKIEGKEIKINNFYAFIENAHNRW